MTSNNSNSSSIKITEKQCLNRLSGPCLIGVRQMGRHLQETERRTLRQEDCDCRKIGFMNVQAPALIRMIY